MERKSFMFYMTWEALVDRMTDEELRRFINNLFRFHRGEEVVLTTRLEEMTWIGILPALKINVEKYEQKVASSKENGKLGGAPQGNQNASKSKTTQNNQNNPIIEKREKKTDNRKKKKENSQLETEDQKQENENREQKMDSTSTISTGAYSGKYTGTNLLQHEIEEINYIINTQYADVHQEGKDVIFKGHVKQMLQQKVLSTGKFKPEFFESYTPAYINIAEQKLTREEFKTVEPMLLEYNHLVYSY
jgi:hypothetical protein